PVVGDRVGQGRAGAADRPVGFGEGNRHPGGQIPQGVVPGDVRSDVVAGHDRAAARGGGNPCGRDPDVVPGDEVALPGGGGHVRVVGADAVSHGRAGAVGGITHPDADPVAERLGTRSVGADEVPGHDVAGDPVRGDAHDVGRDHVAFGRITGPVAVRPD